MSGTSGPVVPSLLGKIADVLRGLIFPTNSVDSAIAGLTKAAKKLEAAERSENARAQALTSQANALMSAAAAKAAGAARAARVREKLSELTA